MPTSGRSSGRQHYNDIPPQIDTQTKKNCHLLFPGPLPAARRDASPTGEVCALLWDHQVAKEYLFGGAAGGGTNGTPRAWRGSSATTRCSSSANLWRQDWQDCSFKACDDGSDGPCCDNIPVSTSCSLSLHGEDKCRMVVGDVLVQHLTSVTRQRTGSSEKQVHADESRSRVSPAFVPSRSSISPIIKQTIYSAYSPRHQAPGNQTLSSTLTPN